MSPKFPVLKSHELIRILEQHEFVKISQEGSHVKMRNQEGTTIIIPVHHGTFPAKFKRTESKEANPCRI